MKKETGKHKKIHEGVDFKLTSAVFAKPVQIFSSEIPHKTVVKRKPLLSGAE